MPTERTINLLSESPAAASDPGHLRRMESLAKWASDYGVVNRVALLPVGQHTRSERIRRAREADVDRLGLAPGPVVISGLGAAHLVAVASRLSHDRHVVFDACDSWILQARVRVAARRPDLALSSAAGAISQLRADRAVIRSYISERDSSADRRLQGGARSIVISQEADPSLDGLPPVTGKTGRIVVVADFRSFHNRKGLALLDQALSAGSVGVPIEFYGPTPPPRLPPGTVYAGWVDNISETLVGNTAVFITNIDGSGVPNKLLEAKRGRRRIVASACFSQTVSRYRGAHLFTNADDLRDRLLAVAQESGPCGPTSEDFDISQEIRSGTLFAEMEKE